MNVNEGRLEGRLRGLFGSLDARAGFEQRVMARVAALAAQRGARICARSSSAGGN